MKTMRKWGRILGAGIGLGLLPALSPAQPLFGAGPLTVQRRSDAVVGVYVPGWESPALLERLRPGSASHLLYAFLRLCGPGQLAKDAHGCQGKADFELVGDPAHARFDAAFVQLKAREPELRVLASVGGWGGSDPFFPMAADASSRSVFVAAVLRFLREHPGFDGIDIDWEHPGDNGAANGVQLGSPQDGAHFVALMLGLRRGLDQLGQERGRRYLLTVAVNTTAQVVKRIDWRQAAPPLDLVFMMSYDYYGGWSERLGHHATLRSSRVGADDSLEQGVRNFIEAGVPAAKLVAGIAMYGRGFGGSASGITGAAKQGVFPAGADGSIVYRELASDYLDRQGRGKQGFEARFDARTQAWYLHDAQQQRYIGYDDPRAVIAKARFARKQGLAGVFAWELSQDNGDLLNAMNRGLGNRLLPNRR